MVILVTGVNGQLGHDVMNEIYKRGIHGVGTGSTETYSGITDHSAVTMMPYMQLDITNREAVNRAMDEVKPDAVIHCSAWTAVDLAEDEEQKEHVYRLNVAATENIALACKAYDSKMMYFSTDYVFDGTGTTPWKADEKNYHPLNYYGETKLQGENAINCILDKFFIVRTAWVFGVNGNNFVKTMLKLSETHATLRVVSDQIGTPTYSYDLARLAVDMIVSEKYGYYNATNEGGFISWYEFACAIFKLANKTEIQVIPVSTCEYGIIKAERPLNSRLDKEKLSEMGFTPLPTWQDALGRYFEELKSIKQ